MCRADLEHVEQAVKSMAVVMIRENLTELFKCNALAANHCLRRNAPEPVSPRPPPPQLSSHPHLTPLTARLIRQFIPIQNSVLSGIVNYSPKIVFVCLFHFRDREPTAESTEPDHLCFMCPVTSLAKKTSIMSNPNERFNK